ncbi:tRNA wybutosine-synthesizing protein 2 [Cladobotryum mycophilum]|uniref:tRNA wybutosine-synthesizing protein 2 n=1 Tax=Cladobotryum mycophilum TaxID=491253 RepID=A0ABR0T0K7_9HYPO
MDRNAPPTDTPRDESWTDVLLRTQPKRFTIYEPMVLLPSCSFTNEAWASLLGSCDDHIRTLLWALILEELSKSGKGKLTHLAVNEGIPLHKEGEEVENVRRSPNGLRMLYGDFGSAETDGEPAESDFETAFWVETKQNGIIQTWAPRWTMFSRGNIKEKARVLSFKRLWATQDHPSWAVDLYAGIGYFTFSYASLGLRVLCWEINPWSVEGLRRGAEMNRWSVRVVQGRDLGLPLSEIMAGDEQIIVFLESNEEALRRVRGLQDMGLARNVKHVNCGFLPTSEPVWKSAWEMTSKSPEAWLHLHENVAVEDTDARRQEIDGLFQSWHTEEEKEGKKEGETRTAKVTHFEMVKSYAPGVWHCVYDVHVYKNLAIQ